MRGIPDHANTNHSEPPPDFTDFSALAVAPGSFILKKPMPAKLATLGREVLDMVPRAERGSLAAYRQAANNLAMVLRVDGIHMKPVTLYHAALRVKWIRENTEVEPC